MSEIFKKNVRNVQILDTTEFCGRSDNSFCSKNSDCADTQHCISIEAYSYPVCKTNNEVPEKTLNKSSFPPPLELLDWFSLTVPTLAASVLARCTLGGILNTVPDVVGSVLDSDVLDSVTDVVDSLLE